MAPGLLWPDTGQRFEVRRCGRQAVPAALRSRGRLVTVYYRTNLASRQVALLFKISNSAAGRVVDHLAPLLALAPVARRHSRHRADRGRRADGSSITGRGGVVKGLEELPGVQRRSSDADREQVTTSQQAVIPRDRCAHRADQTAVAFVSGNQALWPKVLAGILLGGFVDWRRHRL